MNNELYIINWQQYDKIIYKNYVYGFLQYKMASHLGSIDYFYTLWVVYPDIYQHNLHMFGLFIVYTYVLVGQSI